MNRKIYIKEKLLLLIILAIAAGFLSLLPQENIKQKHLSDNTPKLKEKINKNTVNCNNNTKSDLSIITDNDQAKAAPDACLFIGCSGFSF